MSAAIALREDEAMLIVQDALDSASMVGGFTYVHFARHVITETGRVFYTANGHRNRVCQTGSGPTIGDAVAAMLVAKPFDTSGVESAA